MRAVVYPRVSGAEQRERHTIASQLTELPRYIRAQGWELVRPANAYIDDGRSAKAGQLERRDGFARLVADAQAGVFDVVVVVDVDRFTRTNDMLERSQILSIFQRANVQIATPAGGLLDMRTFLGEFYVTLRAMFAAEENRARVERSTRGKRAAADAGRKVSGSTPFGLVYDRETHEWSLDQVAAPVIREMATRALAGESCYALAMDLARRQVARPRGGRWTRGRVHEVLTSRHICGEYFADVARRVIARVPPIISRDHFDDLQLAMAGRSRQGVNATKHTYVVQGLAVCGTCGTRLTVRSARIERRMRRTYQRAANYQCPTGCSVAKRFVAEIDDRVWAAVVAKLRSNDLFDDLAAELDTTSDDHEAWARDATDYRTRIARLDTKEAALLARFRSDAISEDVLDRELAEMKRERNLLRSQLAIAERAAKMRGGAKARLGGARAFVESIRGRLPRASLEQRQEIVRALVDPGGVTVGVEVRVVLWIPSASSRGSSVKIAPGIRTFSGAESRLRISVVA